MAVAFAAVLEMPRAHAENEWEIGGFAGLHVFSQDNEIGVADIENASSPKNSFAMGLRVAYALTPMFALEGEAGFLPAKVRLTSAELLGVVYRLHGVVHFGNAKLRPFVLVGAGGMSAWSSERNVIDNDEDFVFHAGAGIKYRLGDSWGVRADARLLLPPSSANESVTTDFEALLGIYGTFPRKKAPEAPKDTDGDGFDDDVDQCIDAAEDMDGFQDDDGCPEKDNDSDGIEDASDQCPTDAEDIDGFQDEDGCPENDNDNDGIEDASDQCPTDAEDVDGFQDEDGCPDNDNDGDGVADAADKCPTELESKNGYEDDDGCPDTIPRQVMRYTGTIKGITFENNKAVIRKTSFRTLDAAVKVLQEYPKLRIEISGHSDSTGDADYNRDLSRQRAEAVMAYLIVKGIDASRLQAAGYGPDRPIADNKTKAGRAKNRRVEFNLISDLIEVEVTPASQPQPANP